MHAGRDWQKLELLEQEWARRGWAPLPESTRDTAVPIAVGATNLGIMSGMEGAFVTADAVTVTQAGVQAMAASHASQRFAQHGSHHLANAVQHDTGTFNHVFQENLHQEVRAPQTGENDPPPHNTLEWHPQNMGQAAGMLTTEKVLPRSDGPYAPNNDTLSPNHVRMSPGPILTAEDFEEYLIEKIVDAKRCGRGWRYLVRWIGYGAEEDMWLPGREVADCEALDVWLKSNPCDA